ncbi:glycosyl transferase family 1 [Scytonema hofmannii PCC 7110]|uniref:Glycosyl transferase family 1 n=1 Tax=Scytonema hofmannii PCC 7110 TaxID=128403 RepID=A0A139WWQ6_9CYAN|nr:glycosyltransferase [Scytonema hofmannii]KYC36871.1 glycosyl transferase family 1 [Scytonema hofmannii PCC 7110]
MKVLHVIPSVAPVRGGPSLAAIEMVKALQDRGVEAEIATTNDNGPDLLDIPLGQRTEYHEVPIWFFSRFSPNSHAVREFAFSSQLTAWLWQEIHQYDLLHIHAIFSYPSTVAMAIARQKQVPYIVRPLGQLCQWSLQQSARKKQIYLQLIETANLKGSQALHLTSKQEQQEVSLLSLNTPNFILPHGLSIPPTIPDARQRLRQYLNIPLDEPVILFLSRLHPKKGLDYLIPALGKLNNYRFTFVLAGNGSPECEKHVESLIFSHGIRTHTHITGFVEGERKNILMQGADLFALTSHSENFGVAVLEALAVGLPVLVTPGVALADLVKEERLGYVPELDVTAIASLLKQALEHPQEAKSMGKYARKLISEKYTWRNISSNLIEIYTKIINQNELRSMQ